MALDRLWYEVPHCDSVRWHGKGWRDDGVAARLLEQGLRVVHADASGLLVEPLPAWLPPSRHFRIADDDPVLEAYEPVQEAAGLLGARTGLTRAPVLLRRAAAALDQIDGGSASPIPQVARPAVLAGWHGRTSVLSTTVARLRRACTPIVAPRRPPPSAIARLHAGAWRTVLAPHALDRAVTRHGALVDTLAEAAVENWPALHGLIARARRHPLFPDAGRLHELLATAGSVSELADAPRPELGVHESRTPPEGETTIALVWWALIGPDLLRGGSGRRLSATEMAVMDLLRRLISIGLDVIARAPIPLVLGDVIGGRAQ